MFKDGFINWTFENNVVWRDSPPTLTLNCNKHGPPDPTAEPAEQLGQVGREVGEGHASSAGG